MAPAPGTALASWPNKFLSYHTEGRKGTTRYLNQGSFCRPRNQLGQLKEGKKIIKISETTPRCGLRAFSFLLSTDLESALSECWTALL